MINNIESAYNNVPQTFIIYEIQVQLSMNQNIKIDYSKVTYYLNKLRKYGKINYIGNKYGIYTKLPANKST